MLLVADKFGDMADGTRVQDSITIFSDVLVERFGADACRVVEDQIEAAAGTEAVSTWISIWEHLCSQEARRA